MASSTTLYATDLNRLRDACGSKDAAVVEAVLDAEAEHDGGKRPVDWRKGPFICVTWRGELLLHGEPVTKDELAHALLEPRWTGTMLDFHIEPAPDGEERQGEFRELGSFYQWLVGLGPFFMKHGTTLRDQFVGTSARSEPRTVGAEDEISDEDALRDLINGKFTKKSCGADYGYALERLSGVIGTRLAAVGSNRMRSLELKTKLSKTRSPVKLPRIADFPYISYLEREDVVEEYERYREIRNIGDEQVDEERRCFVKCLQEASRTKLGIIGFYY